MPKNDRIKRTTIPGGFAIQTERQKLKKHNYAYCARMMLCEIALLLLLLFSFNSVYMLLFIQQFGGSGCVLAVLLLLLLSAVVLFCWLRSLALALFISLNSTPRAKLHLSWEVGNI